MFVRVFAACCIISGILDTIPAVFLLRSTPPARRRTPVYSGMLLRSLPNTKQTTMNVDFGNRYTAAEAADMDPDTRLGDVIITEPYIDAIGSENDWLVTLARAVYR